MADQPDESIDRTLSEIRSAAEAGSRDPKLRRWLLETLFDAVRTQPTTWSPDPVGSEFRRNAIGVLRGETDHCDPDEICTALGAVLVAAGFEVRVVAHAFREGGGFEHCVLQVRMPEGWVNADAHSGVKLGDLAARPSAEKFGQEMKRT